MVRALPPDEERCTGHKRNGERCRFARADGTDTCANHDADPDKRPLRPVPGLPPDEKRCTGHISGGYDHLERAGERCPNWRMQGLTVCHAHGGMAHKETGRLRVAEEKLMAQAADLVGVPVENPLTELASLAGRARALMEKLEARVEALFDMPDDTGSHEEQGGIRYRGAAGEQIRGEVQLYERAMDRLGRLLVDIGRLNIDDRLARIEERQVEAIVAAIEAGLTAAGVRDPGQRSLAKSAAARHLRAV